MLQMVPLPVALMVRAPSPKNSTMWPVPPLTVRMDISFKMTSLGPVHPDILPVSFTPMTPGQRNPKS